jgi:hypothetical protein
VNPSRAPAADRRLDELYRGPPGAFVAGRDQLVKDLRAAGRREEAQRVGKLRRPTVAAALINHAALEAPDRLAEFADASRRLEEAQDEALHGAEEGGAKWREAAAGERDAIEAVVELVGRLAGDSGHPASQPAMELVGETLRAASVDPELRDRVLRGRLEREQSGATLGTPAAGPVARRGSGSPSRQSSKARARRDLARLERELADAAEREERLRAQAGRTEEALARERAALAEARRITAELRRKMKAAKRTAPG